MDDRKKIAEKIFDRNAKIFMLNWSLNSFKDTHPRLFKSIIESMIDFEKSENKKVELEDTVETLEAQLRNKLSPFYILADVVLMMEESEKKTELLKKQANLLEELKPIINEILKRMENRETVNTEKGYPLIPMNEITDEAREIAVRWMECDDKNWIENKHKLASDIMNYAKKYSAKSK